MADDKPLYNPNDNITGRDGGPYLDVLEAQEAEERRAAVENRKPADNPPAHAGIPLVTGEQLLSTASVNNLPSQNQRYGLGVADSVALVNEREKTTGLKAVGSIPADYVETARKQAEQSDEDFTISTDSKNTGGQQATTRSATKAAGNSRTK